MRRFVSGLIAAAMLVSLPGTAFADAAGSAKGVAPAASAELDGATRTLVVGSDIFIGDQVVTGAKGQVQILFADNTRLVVGPNSSLKMEDYLVRNDGDAGKFVVDMLSGTFRFATGNAPKNKYQIDTPTGTIGVRGTEFDVFVDSDGVTRILHYLGVVIFRAKSEKTWQLLKDACTLGQISDKATILGNSKSTTGDARTQLKREFRYADNQSPLLRNFWFTRALDCLHNTPVIVAPRDPSIEDAQPAVVVVAPTPTPAPDPTPPPNQTPPPGCPLVRRC